MANQTEQLDQIWLTIACDPINQQTTVCGFSESKTEADEYERELEPRPEFEFALIKSFLFIDAEDTSLEKSFEFADALYDWFRTCGVARGQAKQAVIELVELIRSEIEKEMEDESRKTDSNA